MCVNPSQGPSRPRTTATGPCAAAPWGPGPLSSADLEPQHPGQSRTPTALGPHQCPRGSEDRVRDGRAPPAPGLSCESLVSPGAEKYPTGGDTRESLAEYLRFLSPGNPGLTWSRGRQSVDRGEAPLWTSEKACDFGDLRLGSQNKPRKWFVEEGGVRRGGDKHLTKGREGGSCQAGDQSWVCPLWSPWRAVSPTGEIPGLPFPASQGLGLPSLASWLFL